ncbi:MAG: cysteine protease [Planctomycetales bacterium]|nr:cysteine protease [Planctomycetales bacterium]NIM09056.1 cysteine protease [Planctomycetales bacterium]NIN08519.1 cysteine protease [Planctomycetales bacterium]NIN77653.1 cysteine protease [Planctomycetales bacterium]NIP04697.1 cysteine protease [Planctomycetales bacterium]
MFNTDCLSFGWHPDIPDFRDYRPQSSRVSELLGQLKASGSKRKRLPTKVDLREYFPQIYDQGNLNSSTSHACIGLFEYFQTRAFGTRLAPSRLFLYKTTRNLLGLSGNVPVSLRSCLKAMRSCGIPPERLWAYDEEKLDVQPDAYLFSFADQYRDFCYVRLDAQGATGITTLKTVKSFLAAGFPSAFGLPIASSLSQDGHIQYRPTFDTIRDGQAMVAVGYDDKRLDAARGALLIRSSWGRSWGEEGYGWLPYAYVEKLIALDFWTLLREDWVATAEYTRPRISASVTAKTSYR